MTILQLPIIFAILGFIASSDSFLLFLNKLNPLQGLLFYYFIIFTTITILQWYGLVVGNQRMKSVSQSIGEICIIFAFFVIFNFESAYVQWIIDKKQHHKSNCSDVYLQSEDGAVFYVVDKYIKNPRITRLITFVLVPFILCIIGLYLITDKVDLSLF